jgi:hypothetical protein
MSATAANLLTDDEIEVIKAKSRGEGAQLAFLIMLRSLRQRAGQLGGDRRDEITSTAIAVARQAENVVALIEARKSPGEITAALERKAP